MQKQIVTVPGGRNWEAEYGFQPAVKLGNMVYIAGLVGCDEKGVCVSDDIEPQVVQVFQNLQDTLRAAGSDLANMLQMTVFIIDIHRNGPPFWALRRKIMPNTIFASAVIGVYQLADPRLLIEIQGVAYCER